MFNKRRGAALGIGMLLSLFFGASQASAQWFDLVTIIDGTGEVNGIESHEYFLGDTLGTEYDIDVTNTSDQPHAMYYTLQMLDWDFDVLTFDSSNLYTIPPNTTYTFTPSHFLVAGASWEYYSVLDVLDANDESLNYDGWDYWRVFSANSIMP